MAEVASNRPTTVPKGQVAPTQQTTELSLDDFATYEDYLDAQITPKDLFYLEDKELARQLVELGYRGNGEPIKREEFEQRKRGGIDRGMQPLSTSTTAEHSGTAALPGMHDGGVMQAQQHAYAIDYESMVTPFMRALKEREEGNRTGKLSSIIFVRDRNGKNQGACDIAYHLILYHRGERVY
jgi:hypothetical protein